MSLGFYHFTCNNRSAVDASIASFRKFYPEAPYFLVCDGGAEHVDICKKYNVEYYHSPINIGYPSPIVGYDKSRVYEFVKRIYIACITLNTTHILISEDDVHCLNTITYDKTWEYSGYSTPLINSNPLSEELLKECENQSGVPPDVDCYGVGAGAILKVSTFIKGFNKFSNFLLNKFDSIHTNYPQLGWNDCFLQTYFMLLGKPYTMNPRLYNNNPENPNIDLMELSKDYDIIHHYKNFYENRITKS